MSLPRGRRLGLWLLGLAGLFMLLTLGLAFTVFGEIAALLAVICLIASIVLLVRADRQQRPS